MSVGGRRLGDKGIAEGELAGLVGGRGDVVEQCGVDPAVDHADHVGARIAFPHPAFDALQSAFPVRRRDLVEFVHHHQRRRTVAGRCGAASVNGVEVPGGVDDVDDTAVAHPGDLAEPDDAGDRCGIGNTAGFDDDGVEAQLRIGQLGQGGVELAVVGQAADAAAGDRCGFVDLTAHQCGIDIDIAEVVDDGPDPGAGCRQDVVEQGCLTRTQMTGERNDGHRHHSAMVPHKRCHKSRRCRTFCSNG